MNIKIREANIKDIDKGLLDVYIQGYKYHQNGRPDIFIDLSDEILKEDLIKSFEKLSTLVIFDNDNIVGYISYKVKEKYSKKLYINQLAIDERYRGKGLGKKLIDKVKNIALKNNCNRIELNCWIFNNNALALYEHIGFNKQRIIYEMPL